MNKHFASVMNRYYAIEYPHPRPEGLTLDQGFAIYGPVDSLPITARERFGRFGVVSKISVQRYECRTYDGRLFVGRCAMSAVRKAHAERQAA